MDTILLPKSYDFALKIVRLYQFLSEQKREFILSKQLLRSGTAIGALVREGEHAQSKADFANKLNIALKEANETAYWLCLLKDSNLLSEKEFVPIHAGCCELIRLLASILKTLKKTT